jgi:arginyl-tRNA synthetase
LKFREFEEEVRSLLSDAVKSAGYPRIDVDVSLPSDPSFGDATSTIALKLSKTLSVKPAEIAAKIKEKVKLKGKRYVADVAAHPAGYLNFMLNLANFTHDTLEEILTEKEVGRLEVGKGKSLAIEHTNVNPSKALHVGHARNLVLGDSLSRIVKHLGYSLQVLDYIDDSGAQVADVIVGLRFLGWKDEPPPGMKFDVYCGDSVYVGVNQEYERNPALKEKQSLVLREIESGVGEIAEYSGKIVDRILREQLKTCWRLGASYDLLNWESHFLKSKMWDLLFEEMKKRGLAILKEEGENKGCWVIIDPETKEEKVLVRSDGTTVYVAKDIPYAAWKIGLVKDPFSYDVYATQPDGSPLWTTAVGGVNKKRHPKFGSVDKAISFIDARQSYLQKIVGKVLEGLKEGSSERYHHRSYEVVALSKRTAASLGFEMKGEFVAMQGRKGIYVNADTILEALKNKAIEETKKRNPEDPSDWVEKIAEAVAVAALRFELVKQDPDKVIVFDLEDSLRLEGETGPYLLYSYARARRIIEKSGERPTVDSRGASLLSHPLEKELIKKISMFDISLLTAGEYLSPKEVARYAYKLSVLFNEFYEALPVIKAEDNYLRGARLALVEAFSRALNQALLLIGISAPDRI